MNPLLSSVYSLVTFDLLNRTHNLLSNVRTTSFKFMLLNIIAFLQLSIPKAVAFPLDQSLFHWVNRSFEWEGAFCGNFLVSYKPKFHAQSSCCVGKPFLQLYGTATCILPSWDFIMRKILEWCESASAFFMRYLISFFISS